MATAEASRPGSPTPSELPPVPASPVYSLASTANPLSQFSLPLPPAPRRAHAVLTKADLEHSQEAYANLLSSAKAYRLALAALSTAASTFGTALESCARLKEARAEPIGPQGAANLTASYSTKGSCTADTLMSASGVQHLVANHQQILSETVYRSFEVPLMHDLDRWQTVIDDEEETYKQRVRAQTREIKRLEKDGLKLHKQRRRDVARFRAHLVQLTDKLDGLTTLHADHAGTRLRESQDTSARILDASCSLVRAEVDIFESLARKGWSGGGLDDLLEKGQDLFAHDDEMLHAGAAAETAKLFSILPPKSILADTNVAATDGPSSRAAAGHVRRDSLGADNDRYRSLTAVMEDPRDNDSDSVFSADFNVPRSARPFSPQPIRRIPTGVKYDSLGAAAAAAVATRDDGDVELRRSQFLLPVSEDGPDNETPQHVDNNDDAGHDSKNGQDADAAAEDERQGPSRPETPRSVRSASGPEFMTDESSPGGTSTWSNIGDGSDDGHGGNGNGGGDGDGYELKPQD